MSEANRGNYWEPWRKRGQVAAFLSNAVPKCLEPFQFGFFCLSMAQMQGASVAAVRPISWHAASLGYDGFGCSASCLPDRCDAMQCTDHHRPVNLEIRKLTVIRARKQQLSALDRFPYALAGAAWHQSLAVLEMLQSEANLLN